MSCPSCNKRPFYQIGGNTQGSSINGTTQTIKPNTFDTNTFIKAVYLGDARVLNSVVNGLNYGKRATGDLIFIAAPDYQANSGLYRFFDAEAESKYNQWVEHTQE